MEQIYQVKLTTGKQFEYELPPGFSDELAETIRRGSNPCFDHFIRLAQRYRLPFLSGCVLDIGANLGCCTFAFAVLNRKVIAFEANTALSELLKRNAVRNQFDIEVVHAAVTDRSSTLEFRSAGPYGFIASEGTPDGGLIEKVAGLRLNDWYLTQRDLHVAFIKMDIEGSEVAALRGADRFLAAHSYPPIYLEANSHCLRWFGENANSLMAVGSGYGYRCFRVEPAGLRPMNPGEIEPCGNLDYFFIRSEHINHFETLLLRPFGKGEISDLIIQELSHAHPHRRASIARTLQGFPDHVASPRISELLRKLEDDADEGVRDGISWRSSRP